MTRRLTTIVSVSTLREKAETEMHTSVLGGNALAGCDGGVQSFIVVGK